MAARIFEHPIPDTTPLRLPRGARILKLDVQNDTPTIWAAVDPDADQVVRSVAIVGTGGSMPPEHFEYVDSVQLGPLVWHIFLGAELT